MKTALCAVFATVLCSTAWSRTPDGDEKKDEKKASDGTQRQIEDLTAELKAQKTELDAQRAQIDALKASQQPRTPLMTLGGNGLTEVAGQDHKAGEGQLSVTFTDGFHLRSSDGAFDLHIGGRWEEEYRYTLDRPIFNANTFSAAATQGNTGTQNRTSVNTFYIREAFISVDGTLYKDWGFKLNGDFSPAQTQVITVNNSLGAGGAGAAPQNIAVSTGAIAETAFVEWKHFKEFTIQFGQFKAPIEGETLTSPLFAETIQRSILSKFVPNFDLGAQIYGSFMESSFTYQFAVQNGRSPLANQGRSNPDDNDGKEYTGRITIAPFAPDKGNPLRLLRLGLAGSIAQEGQGVIVPGVGYNAFGPLQWPGGLSSTELAVTYLQSPGGNVNFTGTRSRANLEAVYAYGPVGIRAEGLQRLDEYQVTGGAGVVGENRKLPITGGYVLLAANVTGEDYIPDARPGPAHPFDLATGDIGQLMVVARVADVTVGRQQLNHMNPALLAPVAGSADDFNSSNHITAFTVGFNWWPTKNIRMAFNYVYEDYHYHINWQNTGAPFDRHDKALSGMLAHFQVDF